MARNMNFSSINGSVNAIIPAYNGREYSVQSCLLDHSGIDYEEARPNIFAYDHLTTKKLVVIYKQEESSEENASVSKNVPKPTAAAPVVLKSHLDRFDTNNNAKLYFGCYEE